MVDSAAVEGFKKQLKKLKNINLRENIALIWVLIFIIWGYFDQKIFMAIVLGYIYMDYWEKMKIRKQLLFNEVGLNCPHCQSNLAHAGGQILVGCGVCESCGKEVFS